MGSSVGNGIGNSTVVRPSCKAQGPSYFELYPNSFSNEDQVLPETVKKSHRSKPKTKTFSQSSIQRSHTQSVPIVVASSTNQHSSRSLTPKYSKISLNGGSSAHHPIPSKPLTTTTSSSYQRTPTLRNSHSVQQLSSSTRSLSSSPLQHTNSAGPSLPPIPRFPTDLLSPFEQEPSPRFQASQSNHYHHHHRLSSHGLKPSHSLETCSVASSSVYHSIYSSNARSPSIHSIGPHRSRSAHQSHSPGLLPFPSEPAHLQTNTWDDDAYTPPPMEFSSFDIFAGPRPTRLYDPLSGNMLSTTTNDVQYMDALVGTLREQSSRHPSPVSSNLHASTVSTPRSLNPHIDPALLSEDFKRQPNPNLSNSPIISTLSPDSVHEELYSRSVVHDQPYDRLQDQRGSSHESTTAISPQPSIQSSSRLHQLRPQPLRPFTHPEFTPDQQSPPASDHPSTLSDNFPATRRAAKRLTFQQGQARLAKLSSPRHSAIPINSQAIRSIDDIVRDYAPLVQQAQSHRYRRSRALLSPSQDTTNRDFRSPVSRSTPSPQSPTLTFKSRSTTNSATTGRRSSSSHRSDSSSADSVMREVMSYLQRADDLTEHLKTSTDDGERMNSRHARSDLTINSQLSKSTTSDNGKKLFSDSRSAPRHQPRSFLPTRKASVSPTSSKKLSQPRFDRPGRQGSHSNYSLFAASSSAPKVSAPRRHGSTSACEIGRSSVHYKSLTQPLASSPAEIEDEEERIARYIKSAKLTTLLRLHRQPQPISVSFADVGQADGHPVVVFLGLGCVRYLIGLYDELAEVMGLRLICIDRWGLGKTSMISDHERGFLEWSLVVEEVMDRLQIDQFSVMAHSAGAPYALGTCIRLQHRIKGSVHLLAPWLHSHSEEIVNTVANPTDCRAVNTRMMTVTGGIQAMQPAPNLQKTQGNGLANNYKWLKYIPNSMIKTAQTAEWKMQAWMLGKMPAVNHQPVGFDKDEDISLMFMDPEIESPYESEEDESQEWDRLSRAELDIRKGPGKTNGYRKLKKLGRAECDGTQEGKESNVRSKSRTRAMSVTERPSKATNTGANKTPTKRGVGKGVDLLGVNLMRAMYSESLKGGISDLIVILNKSKPSGFKIKDLRNYIKVWHGDMDEKIELKSSEMFLKCLNCVRSHVNSKGMGNGRSHIRGNSFGRELIVVSNGKHNLMRSSRVIVEVLESICNDWK